MEFYEPSCKKLTCFSNVSRSAAGGMDTDRTACRFCCLPDQHHFPFYPDESMVYIWKDIPILRVAPERTDTGVMWRMFTRDEGEPLQ